MTVLRIGRGRLEAGAGAADLLEGEQHCRPIEQPLDAGPAGHAGTQGFGRRRLESQPRLVARGIEPAQRAAGDARPAKLDQMEPRHALLVERGHHRDVGGLAIDHRPLLAAQPAGLHPRGNAARTRIAGALGEREAADAAACGDAGQPGAALGFAAVAHQRIGRQAYRGREGHRCQHPADLLGQHAQGLGAHVCATVFLGQRGAEPAHVGHALPQAAIVGVGAIEDAAHRGRRAAIGEKAPRLLAQQLQVIGEIEVHESRSAACRPLVGQPAGRVRTMVAESAACAAC